MELSLLLNQKILYEFRIESFDLFKGGPTWYSFILIAIWMTNSIIGSIN